MIPDSIVSFADVSKYFTRQSGFFADPVRTAAVNSFSLSVHTGKTLGIVGESGCGKSTLARMAVGLMPPDEGSVFINELSLYDKHAHNDYDSFRKSLAGQIQMVFQDPYSSLNPRMSIGRSISEALECSTTWMRKPLSGEHAQSQPGNHINIPAESACKVTTGEIKSRTAHMLELIGLEAAAAKRYPHEFSGGQRQRIAIARALVTCPAFVVCDEPTSSLDASVQSQILNLLQDMQKLLHLTYMFISHDLAVIRHMSDMVAVMYKGYLVEYAEADKFFIEALHPYSKLLLGSVCGDLQRPGAMNEHARPLQDLNTQKAHTAKTQQATQELCPFLSRCTMTRPECFEEFPGVADVYITASTKNGDDISGPRLIRCHYYYPNQSRK